MATKFFDRLKARNYCGRAARLSALAAAIAASASAQSTLPYTLTQLTGTGIPTDLSDDGAVVVGGEGPCTLSQGCREPVRWVRRPDGSYATEYLDSTRQIRMQYWNGGQVVTSADGAEVAFVGSSIPVVFGNMSIYRWSAGHLEVARDLTLSSGYLTAFLSIAGDGDRIILHLIPNNLCFKCGFAVPPWSLETIDRSGASSLVDSGGLYDALDYSTASRAGNVISGMLTGNHVLWVEGAAGWTREIVPTPGNLDQDLPVSLSSNGEWVASNYYDSISGQPRGDLWNRITQRRYPLGSGAIEDFTDDLSTAVISGGLWSRGSGWLGIGAFKLTPDGRHFLYGNGIGELAPRCSNGIDDDGDGRTDAKDPGCSSPSDTSEKEATLACDDAVDQDVDGAIDFPFDPGCASPRSQLESPQCNDNIDNDADGRIDLLDADCSGAWDNSEAPQPPAGGCGIGPELALAIPLLGWLRRRRGSSGESQQARSIPSKSIRKGLDHVLAD